MCGQWLIIVWDAEKQCNFVGQFLYIRYGSQKSSLFFETRYRATVILRSVFVSVPFYNFPCFYCCVSILKVQREERLKNGKKNGAKNGAKTATQRVFSTALFF